MAATASLPLINGRYLIRGEIGTGGMGVVFHATDRLNGEPIALKRVLTPGDHSRADTEGTDLRRSLAQEFRSLVGLRHPNIISVLDYGFDTERQPFFTMELLPGAQTLVEAGQGQALPVQVDLLVQLLQALAYLHRHNIVHRDLKPGNVLCVDSQVKVLDFGLSVHREQVNPNSATTSGTLAYLAPEILGGMPATQSSDLYAVGVMAYEIFAGQHPFDATDMNKLLESVLTRMPSYATVTNEKIDPDLAYFLERLLTKDPADRFRDAQSALAALLEASGESLPAETDATRESFLQSARLVGRDAELARLSESLDATIAGHGSAWLVGGESGVGKSRLLEELRAHALVEGALVLQGQGVSEAALLFQLWREPLRRLTLATDLSTDEASILKPLVADISTLLGREIPDPPPVDPQAAQERLLTVIEALFRRQTQPVIVLLEDLHWVHESLDILTRLIALTRECPLMIVASFRDDEGLDLPAKLPDMRLMKLARLPLESIAELSASMLGEAGRNENVVDLLQRETEGNAFFAVEVVRALAEELGQLDKIGTRTLPDHVFAGGIKQIVQRRLDRIPPDGRHLLEVAAVAGRKLDLGMLRTLKTGMDVDPWLMACAEAAVLEVQDGQWRFVHDKLRDGVLSSLSDAQSRDLHRQVAVALETAYDDPARFAGALVWHWGQAGVPDKEAEYAIRAGDDATALYVYPLARAHYGRALGSLARVADSPEMRRLRVETALKRAVVAWSAEDPGRNLKVISVMEPLAREFAEIDGPAGRLRLARVHYWMGRFNYLLNNPREAIGYYRLALAVGQEFNDDELISIPASFIGQALIVQGHVNKAEPLLRMALPLLENAGNWAEWIRTIGFLGVAMTMQGQYADGVVTASRGLARATQAQFQTGIAASNIYLSAIHRIGGFPDKLRESSQGLIDAAGKANDYLFTYMGYAFRAWAEGLLGNQAAATADMAMSKVAAERVGGRLLLSDWFGAAAAEIALASGDFEEAAYLAEQAAAVSRSVGGVFGEGVSERVWASALAGMTPPRLDDALTHIEASSKAFDISGQLIEGARTHVVWAQLLRQKNDNAGAHDHLTRAITQFELSGLTDELAAARSLRDSPEV